MKPSRTSAVGRLLPIGATVVAAALVLPVGQAQAASDYTVPIPLHPVAVDLRLIGASEVGVAVQQDVVGNGRVDPVYTGPLGGELTRRFQVERMGTDQYTEKMLTVVGDTMAWYEQGNHETLAHRLNILTGKSVQETGSMAVPHAFNGENWFSYGTDWVLDRWYPSGLRRYHAGTKAGSGMRSEIVDRNSAPGGPTTADKTAVLRVTRGYENEYYALDLVTLKDTTVQRIAEGAAEIVGVAMSDDLLVWATRAGDGFVVHQMPREGGPIVTYSESDPDADVAHLVVGEAGVAYLLNEADRTGVVILNGNEARRRDLDYVAEGLASVGDHFLTASAGYQGSQPYYSSAAGVYRITETEFVKVASVPAANLLPDQLSLSAGRLRYSDASGPDYPGDPVQPGRSVFERTVTGDRRAKFSSETRLSSRTAGQMAFSAGRGAMSVPSQFGVWQLLDRGRETEKIEADGAVPNMSGAYTLIGGKVFRPDGEHIYTTPTPPGTTWGQDDLFGSWIVYVRTDAGGKSTIWVDDAEKKDPTNLSTVEAGCDGRTPSASIWGELVAWTSSCGDRIYVRNLQTGVTREVGSDLGPASVSLSEGTLTVHGGSAVRVIDLTQEHLAAVPVPGEVWTRVSVDDHLMARRLNDLPWSGSFRTEMSPLPFHRKLRPRLISTVSPLGFSPNGDGTGDVWAPEFDITKPMRSVTLKIQNQAGTKTVATLDGTAEDGSVRDLRWNGLSSKGMQLPPGTYRWTLTGRSADGDGTLIGSNGSAVVSGAIDLDPK